LKSQNLKDKWKSMTQPKSSQPWKQALIMW
jgi:hypothetical protein